MSNLTKTVDNINAYRIILLLLLVDVGVYFFSGLHLTALQGNGFFSLEQDPLLWLAYYTRVPQFMVQHIWMLVFVDVAVFVLLIWLIIKPYNTWVAKVLLLMLLLFYIVVVGYYTHRNYQVGYLLVLPLFIFKSTKNKQIIFECLRYFLLFFYIMAAYLKISSGALLSAGHMSHAIAAQFTPYIIEQNVGWRTNINHFLITHQLFAQILFFSATIAEALAIVGFFTKKYDSSIAIFLLFFHCCNWVIMDIAPFGHIAFICILFFSKQLFWRK